MSPHSSIVVLADDLTGAAEIGAAAHSRGLNTVIATGATRARITSTVAVHDTDSRLLQPADAARKIASVAARCGVGGTTRRDLLLLKKTDSVLRGPVVAELEALSAVAHRPRILLVPGNPRLGRIIRDGRLFVMDVPIHETVFGHDPHHPARSSIVADLLGPVRRGAIHLLKVDDPLPPAGLIVGEAATPADLLTWASRVDADTLAAGSSVFLEAVLEARGHARGSPSPPSLEPDGVLIASGTKAETTRVELASLPRDAVPAFPMPELCTVSSGPESMKAMHQWAADLLGALAGCGRTVALPPITDFSEPAASGRIRAAFATMIAELHAVRAFRHLIIEGGSTAAMVLHQLVWNVLEVAAEPAPGVATLRPRGADGCHVTVKPGTYPWPSGWWRLLASPRQASLPPPEPHPCRPRSRSSH